MCKCTLTKTNMASSSSIFFLFFFFLSTATSAPDPDLDFIKSACRATRYYPLCLRSLTPFSKTVQQSDKQLARVALAVTLAKARSAAVFVSKLSVTRGLKPREAQAIRDCIDTMGDSVDQLRQSMEEMGRVNGRYSGQEFNWHMSNVMTWVSAAMTDEQTCIDGFSGAYMEGNLKGAVRRRVLHITQVTSNALALVNRFASRFRPRSGAGYVP